MKKLKMTAVVLTAAVLTMSMGMTALADTINKSNQTTSSRTVIGEYKAATDNTVYSVDVEWGSMLFTYNAGDSRVWDPETHTYSGEEGPGWTGTGNEITITNHSNVEVTAQISFEPQSAYSTVSAVWNDNSNGIYTLDRADDGESLGNKSKAPSVPTALELDGDPGNSLTRGMIGTVKVTLVDNPTE